MNAREAALRALYRVDRADAMADGALSQALERVGPGERERSLCTQLVYGVLRFRNRLDWALEACIKRRISQVEPWIRNILRIGAYQILFLDKVPEWAAVDEAVELAKKYGHSGTVSLVNAALRELCRNEKSLRTIPQDLPEAVRISLEMSHPQWLVERWVRRFGLEEAVRLMEANNSIAPLSIRLNSLRSGRERVSRELHERNAKIQPGLYCDQVLLVYDAPRVTDIPSFQEGLFTVQDEASVISGLVVDPKPGETIIDACSAPGGKATHLAELAGDRAQIIAVDVSSVRLAEVSKAARRLGLTSVKTLEADARMLADIYDGKADRVLVDAPCSALGTIRRNPDVKWRRKPEDIRDLAALQGELLKRTARCLKPGGVLVYCTCTTEPEENLGVVGAFLEDHPEFELEDMRPYLPRGLDRDVGASQGYLQLYPHVHGTDGFFLSRLRKKGVAARGRLEVAKELAPV